MSIQTAILAIHVLSGSAALATFWLSALLRKGSPAHRASGRVFLVSMLVVVASGVPLTGFLAASGQPVAATFLAYLLLLVSQGLLGAWRAVRHRHDFVAFIAGPHRVMARVVAVAGAGVVVLGLMRGIPVFAVLGGVGIVASVANLRLAARGPKDGLWWLREHYGAMIGNGVATHIAFLGFGLRSVWPDLDPALRFNLTWLAPVAVAVLASVWLDRRHARPTRA